MTKRQWIEDIQRSIDDARINVNRVNDALLLVLSEGPAKISLDERADMLDDLESAEVLISKAVEAIRSIK
jgi:hypothetical protein